MTTNVPHDLKEEFAIAVGSVLLAPLAPLLIEYGFVGVVSESSLLVAAIMYVAGLAFSTDRKFIFWAGFVAVGYLCLVYGAQVRELALLSSQTTLAGIEKGKLAGSFNPAKTSDDSRAVYNSAIILMVSFGMAHFFQRWRMHLREAQPFLDFKVKSQTATTPADARDT